PGIHNLLSDGLPRRRGPHHRRAPGVRLLAKLRPANGPGVAREAALLEDDASGHAQAAGHGVRPGRPGLEGAPEPLDLPPHRRPGELRPERLSRRHLPRQLAAERLLARELVRSALLGSRRTPGAGPRSEPRPALLDADRGAAAGREAGLEGAAAAAGRDG